MMDFRPANCCSYRGIVFSVSQMCERTFSVSYEACKAVQKFGVVPKKRPNRKAVSAVMPRLLCTISLILRGGTPMVTASQCTQRRDDAPKGVWIFCCQRPLLPSKEGVGGGVAVDTPPPPKGELKSPCHNAARNFFGSSEKSGKLSVVIIIGIAAGNCFMKDSRPFADFRLPDFTSTA